MMIKTLIVKRINFLKSRDLKSYFYHFKLSLKLSKIRNKYG